MINLEYHKGHNCVYSAILCQEGYCSGCEIYLNRIPHVFEVFPEENESIRARTVLKELELAASK